MKNQANSIPKFHPKNAFFVIALDFKTHPEVKIKKSTKCCNEELIDVDAPSNSPRTLSGASAETNHVSGGGVSDDVFMLEKRRDIATNFQGYLHVPEEHNSGLSTQCIRIISVNCDTGTDGIVSFGYERRRRRRRRLERRLSPCPPSKGWWRRGFVRGRNSTDLDLGQRSPGNVQSLVFRRTCVSETSSRREIFPMRVSFLLFLHFLLAFPPGKFNGPKSCSRPRARLGNDREE